MLIIFIDMYIHLIFKINFLIIVDVKHLIPII